MQARLLLVDLDRTVRPVGSSGLLLARAAFASFVLLGGGILTCLFARPEAFAGVGATIRGDALRLGKQVGNELRCWFSQSSNTDRTVLLAITLFGVLLRLQFLPQPMGYDESTSFVYFISRSFLDIASDYSIPNNHVFHSLLARASFSALGQTPAALRIPAFLAGVTLIPATYWIARRLYDGRTALLAAGFVSVAPAIVEFSTQARGYTIVTLCFVVALLCASYLAQDRFIVAWVVFATALVVSLYTTPASALGCAAAVIWIMAVAHSRRRPALYVELSIVLSVVAAATLALYLPILVRSGLRSLIDNPYVQGISLSQWDKQSVRTVRSLASCWTGALDMPASAILWLGGAVALIPSRITKARASWSLLLSIAAAIALIFITRRIVPWPRVLTFAFPAAAMLSAHGLATIYGRLGRGGSSRILWAVLVLLACLIWGGARISDGGSVWLQGRSKLTGYEGINSCAEGYFADAEPIVQRLHDDLDKGAVVYADVYSGIVEPLQYYLLDAGFSPLLAQPYRPWCPLEQLSQREEAYFVVKLPVENGMDSTGFSSLLGLEEEAYDVSLSKPQLIAKFVTSDIYRIESRHRHVGQTDRIPLSITYPDNTIQTCP
ncbi:MAG: glycosyltransferase family 39 protein [Gemmatimonadales bacterium]